MKDWKLSRRTFLKASGGSYAVLANPFSFSTPVRDLGQVGTATGIQAKLLDFAHVTDVHITDSSNPLTLPDFYDFLPQIPITWRPQKIMSARILNAAIKKINEQPLDFTIFTGDEVDNTLCEELRWFKQVADGEDLDVDYLENGMSPFDPGEKVAGGLNMPWYMTIGNHDNMILGNLPSKLMKTIFARLEESCDFEIALQDDLIEIIGGGLVDEQASHGFANMPPEQDGYYAFTPHATVRCIVLNTVNNNWMESYVDEYFLDQAEPEFAVLVKRVEAYARKPRDLDELRAIYEDFLKWFDNHNEEVIGGYASGGMDQVQFRWLQQEIEANRDKICLVFSHHGPHSFLQMGDNISGDQFKTLLRSYDNVAAHISGHTHNNYIYPEKGSEGGYWHIATCALIEYPQEWRRITVRDNGDGTGSLICQMLSHDQDEALRLSVIDPFSSPEVHARHYGKDAYRDVELLFGIPAKVAPTIRANSKPDKPVIKPAKPVRSWFRRLFGF